MKAFIQLLGTRDSEKIKAFLEKNPDILNATDSSGATGYMQLLYHRLPEVIAMAQQIKTNYTFDEAVATGLADQVKKALEEDEERSSAFCADGFTPIGLATFFNQSAIAKLLFEDGADPSICANNPMKVNALHAATAIGNFELLELYLTNGYDPNIPQMNNITPVQSAAHRGDLEMVKILVRHGADPKIKSVDGINAIGYAKEGNHEAVLHFLKTAKQKK